MHQGINFPRKMVLASHDGSHLLRFVRKRAPSSGETWNIFLFLLLDIFLQSCAELLHAAGQRLPVVEGKADPHGASGARSLQLPTLGAGDDLDLEVFQTPIRKLVRVERGVGTGDPDKVTALGLYGGEPGRELLVQNGVHRFDPVVIFLPTAVKKYY